MSAKDKLEGFARNVSGKIRVVLSNGKKIRVLKDGVVPIRSITKVDGQGNVRLPPGFVPEMDDLIVPSLNEPVETGRYASVDEVLAEKANGVEGDNIPGADRLAAMSYNEVRAIAKALGIEKLIRSKLDIVHDIEKLRNEGSMAGDGSITDAGTTTSADIARPPES